jgi:fluoride exporter
VKELVAAFLGGGAGSALRYWLSGAVYRVASPTFPVGTLVVNIAGCFAIGLLMSVFEERFVVQPLLRIFLTIGVLGGFTTFSTFSYETIALLRDGSPMAALLNVCLSVFACLIGTWSGLAIGKLL